MATRFYFPATGSGTPSVSPAFDAGWEQTGQAVRLILRRKVTLSTLSTLADATALTVPITTTQDILAFQFVSDPFPAQNLVASGTLSLVIRVLESALTANVSLAVVAKVFTQDGLTSLGTVFSNFNADTEFAATAATRIVAATTITGLVSTAACRLVVEVGGHAAAPTAGTTYTMRLGNSAASDFALTTALTTDLNPWVELSQNLWDTSVFNYQQVRAGTGISVAK